VAVESRLELDFEIGDLGVFVRDVTSMPRALMRSMHASNAARVSAIGFRPPRVNRRISFLGWRGAGASPRAGRIRRLDWDAERNLDGHLPRIRRRSRDDAEMVGGRRQQMDAARVQRSWVGLKPTTPQ
jgi:hypothetical protein